MGKIEREIYDTICCYSFLPDGKVAVGSQFGLTTLHEAATGKELRKFIGHAGAIWAVAVSPDGRLLISGSVDQTFRLWNIATGELLLSVFVGYGPDGSVGEWVAWTPAGYYKSSPGGDKLIGWHLNRGPDKAAEFVYGWQLRKLFEKPEIVELVLNPMAMSVTAALELHNKQPGQRREQRLDISEDFERLRPPTVLIDEPADYQTVKTERVKLRAKVIPSGQQPVTEVRVLVNGCPVPSFPGLATAVGTGAAQRRDIEGEVELEAGSNLIEVLAGTASASSTPKRVTVIRETRSPNAQPTKPDCYFLGIGVAEYQDKSLDLKFPAADVRDLAAAFQSQQGKLFGKVTTNLVLNSQAVPRRMKAGLSWLQKSATPRDLAVVLVSAHGSTDAQGGFYIAPYDFDVSDPGASGMSKGEFLERLGLLPCKVLCLLDACHSGRVLKGPLLAANTKGLNDVIDRVVAEFNRLPGSLVTWASSTGEELSVEDPAWGHGAFTAALIEALTGELLAPASAGKVTADKDGDGVLHLHELSGYVVDRVMEMTGKNQHPLTGLGSTPSYPLAIVGRPTLLAANLTKQRPRGMRSESITLSLADLKPEEQKDAVKRLAKPARYEDLLKQFYGGKGKVALNSTEAREFEVTRLRGVVTGDTDTWEQLTLNFFVEPLDQEVKITCTAWGQHMKAVGSQPPKPAAFQDQLYADYKEELKRHVIELMNHMKSGLKL